MSFRDVESGARGARDSANTRSDSGGKQDAEQEYNQCTSTVRPPLVELRRLASITMHFPQIAANITRINHNIHSVSKMVEGLGSKKDTQDHRDRMCV